MSPHPSNPGLGFFHSPPQSGECPGGGPDPAPHSRTWARTLRGGEVDRLPSRAVHSAFGAPGFAVPGPLTHQLGCPGGDLSVECASLPGTGPTARGAARQGGVAPWCHGLPALLVTLSQTRGAAPLGLREGWAGRTYPNFWRGRGPLRPGSPPPARSRAHCHPASLTCGTPHGRFHREIKLRSETLCPVMREIEVKKKILPQFLFFLLSCCRRWGSLTQWGPGALSRSVGTKTGPAPLQGWGALGGTPGAQGPSQQQVPSGTGRRLGSDRPALPRGGCYLPEGSTFESP